MNTAAARLAIMRSELRSPTKFVAIRILDLQGLEHGACTKGASALAEECGVSVEAVRTAFKELKRAGLLIAAAEPGRRARRAIDTTALEALSPRPPKRPTRVQPDPGSARPGFDRTRTRVQPDPGPGFSQTRDPGSAEPDHSRAPREHLESAFESIAGARGDEALEDRVLDALVPDWQRHTGEAPNERDRGELRALAARCVAHGDAHGEDAAKVGHDVLAGFFAKRTDVRSPRPSWVMQARDGSDRFSEYLEHERKRLRAVDERAAEERERERLDRELELGSDERAREARALFRAQQGLPGIAPANRRKELALPQAALRRDLTRALPDPLEHLDCKPGDVCASLPAPEVLERLRALGLGIEQLHGDEGGGWLVVRAPRNEARTEAVGS